MWFCVFLTLGYCVACAIAFLSCWSPLSHNWTQYKDPTAGTCVFELYPLLYWKCGGKRGHRRDNLARSDSLGLETSNANNAQGDGFINIHSRRIGCWCLFDNGIALIHSVSASQASSETIYFMIFLKTSVDITWSMGDVFIWSSVELCVGILCACLPTIRPLLRLAFQRLWESLNAERLGLVIPIAMLARIVFSDQYLSGPALRWRSVYFPEIGRYLWSNLSPTLR